MNTLSSLIFDLTPIPMWLEDFSEVKIQLDQWRAEGILDISQFLAEDPLRALHCVRKIKVLKVNPKTLELFEASDLAELQRYLDHIFRTEVSEIHLKQLTDLWQGKLGFSGETFNTTLSGKRVDLAVSGHVLPFAHHDWSCVLLTTEDVTPYKDIAKSEATNRIMAETLFQRSPAALLMQDFSDIKKKIDKVRESGVTHFVAYLNQHPDFVRECLNCIRVLDVNRAALELFVADNQVNLVENFANTLVHDQMLDTFRAQLIMLWDGIFTHQREATFVAFDHSIRYVYLQFTIFPNYEENWGKIQIALTDITARKEAENYLAFLSQHDVLTDLYNRAFYTEALSKLEQQDPQQLSCIYIDLNNLKTINDQMGHAVGDELLKRTGQILKSATTTTSFNACRVGGDEFIILMPNADETTLNTLVQDIRKLLSQSQKHHPQHQLAFSIGSATRLAHESIKDMLHRADQLMYEDKQAYYQKHDRREYFPHLLAIDS